MPRAAWLAAGTAAGSLGLGVFGPVAVAFFGIAVALVAVAARGAGHLVVTRAAAGVALGILAIGMRAALWSDARTASGALPDGAGPFRAAVESIGSPRAGSRPATVRIGAPDGTPILVAATLPWYPPVVPGDIVEVRGRIQPPPDDEYGAYLARVGAVGTLRASDVVLVGSEDGIGRHLESLRRAAADGLDRAMPEPEAGLAAGVLIGLRDRVDRDLASAFATAGASHVVAISGWNIAIVASTLGAVAGGFGRRRRSVLTVAAIIVYVVFVGPSPSVVRAGAMAAIALVAREVGRPGRAAAALALAVAGLLLVDPGWVDDAGFRLSVLATAGIIAWGNVLTARLAGSRPSRVRRWLADVLGVSLAAQAATMPVVLLEFGRLSLVAPAVNLIVVPLVPPAMAAGALALGIGVLAGLGLPGPIATLVGLPAWALYAGIVTAVRAGAALPLASVELPAPLDGICAVASACLVLAAARRGDRWLSWLRRRRGGGATRRTERVTGRAERRSRPRGRQPRAVRAALLVFSVASVGLALVVVQRPDGLARVVVLDVGQGDGILIEGGSGGRLVVDGGPDPSRLLLALDQRLPPWDRRIDILVLTHPHEDHVAGLALLLERYSVGRVYEPGMVGPGPGYAAWAAILAEAAIPHGRLGTGDDLRIDRVRLHVLWPDPNRVPERPPDGGTSINNVSVVLLGEVGRQRFLLMGDVEEGVDPELLARGLPTVDLLKVAHHGSRTASTEAFLEAVRPRIAVVSAGVGNPYGHPAPATLGRLAANAGATYRTDRDGSIEITLTGTEMRARRLGTGLARTAFQSSARSPAASLPGSDLDRRPAAGERAVPPESPIATRFRCSIPVVAAAGSATPGGPPTVVPPPTAPEAVAPAQVAFGTVATARAGAGLPRLPHLREPTAGHAPLPDYHRPDGHDDGRADRGTAPERSPRLLLGRRRVRARGGGRGAARGPGTVPGGGARTLAARCRRARPRPPPG